MQQKHFNAIGAFSLLFLSLSNHSQSEVKLTKTACTFYVVESIQTLLTRYISLFRQLYHQDFLAAVHY